MGSLTKLVRKCLEDGMGFMIESFQFGCDGKESDLLQNNFKYHHEYEKVVYSIRSYFTGETINQTKSLDEALEILMLLLEDHCLTYQKLEEFYNSSHPAKRKNQQLDLIYDEDGLERELLERAPLYFEPERVQNKKSMEKFLNGKKRFLGSIERMVTNIKKMKEEFQNPFGSQ